MKDRCANITKILERYLDGQLSSRKALKVEAHLKECRLCQGRLAELEEIKSLVQETLVDQAADERVQGLWQRVETRLAGQEKQTAWFRWPWIFSLKPALAMLLLIVAVAGFFALSGIDLKKGPALNEVTILSLENSGPGVMVFQSAETDLTVIWILS